MMRKPTPHFKQRYALVRVLLSLLLLIACAQSTITAALEDDEIPNEVKNLRYGVVLYHFYQQSYFDALTESLIGEQRQDMPYHKDSAKLLRGGMSLSYGMGDQAEQIFTELLDELGSEDEKNRAWFYLGKLHYLRGNKNAALNAFSYVEQEKLEQNQIDEFIYLNANLLQRVGQQELADAKIAELDERSPWLAYYYFNRGAAQTVAGNWQQGVETFALVENSDVEDDEGRILQDRAHIASGFAYLGAGELNKAIDDFTAVRMDSPLVDRAMLGYGWAAAQQNDFRKALSPWQALSERSVLSPSVQESLLAVPYAYEKLEALTSALTKYVSAADVLENELATIRAAITLYRDSPMADILAEHSSLGTGWISAQEYLPVNNEAPYLVHLISQDSFQSAISDRNDLKRMANYLDHAVERFAALQDVLNLQKQVWQQSLDSALREKYRERFERLLSIEQTLKQQLNEATQGEDIRGLLDPEQAALWARADGAAERIETLKEADYDVSEEEQTLRLYRGLLAWRASEAFSAKQWEFKKQLAEVSELIEDTRIKLGRIETLSIDRFDAEFASRMAVMEQRINQQAASVKRALALSENKIRRLAMEELQKQDERISYYLSQAKLAIARLYDAGGSFDAEDEQ